MPARCRSRMKPKLHLGHDAQHSQDHAAHWPASIDGRLQHLEACSFFFQFVDEIEDLRVFLPKRSNLTTMRTSPGRMKSRIDASLMADLEGGDPPACARQFRARPTSGVREHTRNLVPVKFAIGMLIE